MKALDKVALYQHLYLTCLWIKMVRVWLNSVKGEIRVAGKIIKTLIFVDDWILLARNEGDLQRMLHSLNNITK